MKESDSTQHITTDRAGLTISPMFAAGFAAGVESLQAELRASRKVVEAARELLRALAKDELYIATEEGALDAALAELSTLNVMRGSE